jgi:hypothetical protein
MLFRIILKITNDIYDSLVASVICEFSQIVKLLNTRFDKKRGERKIKKINTLKTYRNSDDDIISNVEKILTR